MNHKRPSKPENALIARGVRLLNTIDANQAGEFSLLTAELRIILDRLSEIVPEDATDPLCDLQISLDLACAARH